MAWHPLDRRGREGYLTCDHPLAADNLSGCGAQSPRFVMKLGGDLPEGWVVVNPTHTGGRGRGSSRQLQYLCPQHAAARPSG